MKINFTTFNQFLTLGDHFNSLEKPKKDQKNFQLFCCCLNKSHLPQRGILGCVHQVEVMPHCNIYEGTYNLPYGREAAKILDKK